MIPYVKYKTLLPHEVEKEYTLIEDFPEGCFGFIYMITNKETGEYYIGKKQLHNAQNKKLGKKVIAQQTGRGRKKTTQLIISESNWREYWSSDKKLQQQVKELGEDKFERQILDFAYNKKHLTYLEVYYQMLYKVLEDKKSLNDNILGKFFKSNFTTIPKV